MPGLPPLQQPPASATGTGLPVPPSRTLVSAAFSPQVRLIIQQRAGYRCEICAKPAPIGSGAQAHHRCPRGMGGSRTAWKGQPSNGLWLCLGCHQLVETNSDEVYDNGWKVKHGTMPADVPVLLRTVYGHGKWLLDDAGMYLSAA